MRRLLLVLALMSACDTSAPAPTSSGERAPDIALGADGVGTDRADYDCAIALVAAGRVPDGRGVFLTDCAAGPCLWRIRGELAVAGEGEPHVLYRTTGSERWLAAAASEVDGGFYFEISDPSLRPDLSGTALSRAKVELIPYLLRDDGGRLFDHNRLADPFASYELTIGNGFAVARDEGCAPAERLVAPGPDDTVVDWAGGWALYRARAGDAVALPEPFSYTGFSNMGFALQVSVYAEGLTVGGQVDTSKIKVFFESDLMTCDPGGALSVIEVPLAVAGGGPFGNDAIFRQPIESTLSRCPHATYRYRMLVSADGGKTGLALGVGEDLAAPGADAFRTLIHAPR
jgi:hypothetical protein